MTKIEEYLEFANKLSTMEAYYRLKLVQIRNEIDNILINPNKYKEMEEEKKRDEA